MGHGTTTSIRLKLIIEEDAKGLAHPLVVQSPRIDREVQIAGLVDFAGDAKGLVASCF